MKKKKLSIRVARWTAAIAISFYTVLAGAGVHSSDSAKAARVIKIHAKRYAFSPSEISIRRGQTVKLVFVSDDVAHAVAVDGLGLEVEIPAKSSATAIVTPDSIGDFKGRCSRYCGAGHSAMVFVVHVEP
ncbi:cytochrome c oxidase subunit 2 [Silvibacterium bohemicum]|uniref:Cytochrome c oxidase subunit 2 n=1 Tax=Silvibacterium bohemicum TaxID=1577686 RepID=A0A841JWS2_9BACT|nr:cupredoxin domain-containing protein [Silvibacterium bohemicum]MBB6145853.1 cytochrome c oxidase subunit 2 [Silvibacterium bohemicum]